MAVVTVKLDETLKNDASSVLEGLGLDLSSAVRLCLEAIVSERGIPFAATLSAARPAAARPASPSPAVPGRAVKKPQAAAKVSDGPEAFIDLICSVPVGSLTRWTDMEAFLSGKYGREIRCPERADWPKMREGKLAIPYWRVVSERGAVKEDAACSKELREQMLTAEGHALVPSREGSFGGVKVEGYKDKLVQF